MIQPTPGVAFTWVDDGDIRADASARARVSSALGIDAEWATAEQVHGSVVQVVAGPGPAGAGDGVVTACRRLPVAVFTADCFGVVVVGRGVVGVAHAGWRGLAAGVVEETVGACRRLDDGPLVARIGPGIGPCCFEVGADVTALLVDSLAETTWGAPSVDLAAAAKARLVAQGVPAESETRCTACGGGLSHRRDGTSQRMASVGWLP
ncbi:peptidoglycan editing factor PgeF [soil metagenome]